MENKHDGLIIENEPFSDLTIRNFINSMDVDNGKYATIYDYYSLQIIYVFEKFDDAIDVMKLICSRAEHEFPTLAVRYQKDSYIYHLPTREIEIINK